ncbi:MAG: hypothetical protein R2851_07535 [Caldilineaceae bacterium]
MLDLGDGGPPLVYRQDYAEFAGPFRIEGDATAPVHLLATGDLTGSRSGLSSQLPRPLRDLDVADSILLVLNDADVGRFARLPYRGILVATETSADLARVATLSARIRNHAPSAGAPWDRKRRCWPFPTPWPIGCWRHWA